MERRNLVGGGLMASAAALLAADAPPAAAAQRDGLDTQPIVRALEELRRVIDRGQDVSPELTRIREQQRVFLRANQKFPDFMEVGSAVWERVYDWHVRHQQPLAIARTEGRYVMTVMFTTLLLRPDQDPNYVGFGFDAR